MRIEHSGSYETLNVTSGTFFFYLGFLSQQFTTIGLTGKEKGIYLTPHYHFNPLHRYLDISQAVIVDSSPLHIASELEPASFGF